MAKELLKSVYEQVYGEEFSSSTFEKRMEMQKAIYLLQEAGIKVGDYDFLWYKHGPYCQNLQDDILTLNETPDVRVKYSEDAKEVIKRLKEIINTKVRYSRSEWVECLASIQYLKVNIFSFETSEKEIIDELMKRKPHLKDINTNHKAFEQLAYLFG